jgi:hypothetical protein
MIYKSNIKYKKSKKGTTLSAKFSYKDEIRLGVDIKENIQRRLDIGNNDEFKDYLKNAEGLELTSTYFFNDDSKEFERHGGIYPSKKNLRFKIDVISKQQVSEKNMLNLANLDIFLARGITPYKK